MSSMDWGNKDDEFMPRIEPNNRSDISWSQIETGYRFRDFFANRRAEGLKYALSEAGKDFLSRLKTWAIEISDLYGLIGHNMPWQRINDDSAEEFLYGKSRGLG